MFLKKKKGDLKRDHPPSSKTINREGITKLLHTFIGINPTLNV